MDMTIIGFLKADRYRHRILETLQSSATAKQVSHKLRVHQRQTDTTIKELLEKGLVKEDEKGYAVTEAGTKVLAQVSRTGM